MTEGATVGKLKVILGLDDSKFDSGLDKAEGKSRGAGSKIADFFGKAGAALGTAVLSGALIAGQALAGFSAKAIATASDLEEVQNVVDVVFEESASKIEDFASTAGTQFGLSELAAKQFAGTMGALITPTGLANGEITEMSTTLVGLSGDMASFFNISSEEAFNKLRAGISGESEPLKQLGINLSAAEVNAKALELGLVDVITSHWDIKKAQSAATKAQEEYNNAVALYGEDTPKTVDALIKFKLAQEKVDKATEGTTGELSEAAKVQARYALILEKTAKAQGDFANTSDSLANQQRIASLNVENLAKVFGKVLLPQASLALKGLNTLTEGLMPEFEGLAEGLSGILSGAEGGAEQFAESAKNIVEGFAGALGEIIPIIVEVIASLIPAVVEALVAIVPVIAELIPTLVKVIVDSLPLLIDAAIGIIMALIEGLVEAIPLIADTVPKLLITLVTKIVELLPIILDAALKIILALVDGLITAIPVLIEAIPILIQSLVDTIIEFLPLIIDAAGQIVLALLIALIENAPMLLGAIVEIAGILINGIIDLVPVLWEAGKDLMSSLAEGLKSFDFGSVLSNIADGIIAGFQSAMGIQSPSKRMRKEVWSQLIPGIKDELPLGIPNAVRAIDSAVDSVFGGISGASSMAGAGAGGGGSITVIVENVNLASGSEADAKRAGRIIGQEAGSVLSKSRARGN